MTLAAQIAEACQHAREAFGQRRFNDTRHFMDFVEGFDCLRLHFALVNPDLRAKEYVPVLGLVDQTVRLCAMEIAGEGNTNISVLKEHLDLLMGIDQNLKSFLETSQRDAYRASAAAVAGRFEAAAVVALRLIKEGSLLDKDLGLALDFLKRMPELAEHFEDRRLYEPCALALHRCVDAAYSRLTSALESDGSSTAGSGRLDPTGSSELRRCLRVLANACELDASHVPDAKQRYERCTSLLEALTNLRFAALDSALVDETYNSVADHLDQLELLDLRDEAAFRCRFLMKKDDIRVRLEKLVVFIRSVFGPGMRPTEQEYETGIGKIHRFSQALQSLSHHVDRHVIIQFEDEYMGCVRDVTTLHQSVLESSTLFGWVQCYCLSGGPEGAGRNVGENRFSLEDSAGVQHWVGRALGQFSVETSGILPQQVRVMPPTDRVFCALIPLCPVPFRSWFVGSWY